MRSQEKILYASAAMLFLAAGCIVAWILTVWSAFDPRAIHPAFEWFAAAAVAAAVALALKRFALGEQGRKSVILLPLVAGALLAFSFRPFEPDRFTSAEKVLIWLIALSTAGCALALFEEGCRLWQHARQQSAPLAA